MIAWAPLEDAIRAWVVAGSGLSGVIWANQNGPQPAMPYATMAITGPRRVGGTDYIAETTDLGQPAGQEVLEAVAGWRELTVNVQVYCAPTTGAGTAKEYLSSIQTALSLPSVRQSLNTAGLSVIDEGDITDVSALLETKWQSRASLDVRMGVVDTVSEKTGYIATVEDTAVLT